VPRTSRILNMLWKEHVAALQDQLHSMRRQLVLIYTPLAILFVVVIAIRLTTGIAIAELVRDPISFTELPLYTGSLSNLGIMIWSGAGAICFFAWGMLRSRSGDRRVPRFLLTSGIFTTILVLDDFFLLHEEVLPDLGIPQNLVLGAYVVFTLAFVYWFREPILRTRYLLLVLAGLGFGVSIGVDVLVHVGLIWPLFLLEDGAKLFGIVSWTAYYAFVSSQFIARQFRPRRGNQA
jgi:hypothetical protein